MNHECNGYCGNGKHCDLVFTGDTELLVAAPRIARILDSDHGVQVVKVQAAAETAKTAMTSQPGTWEDGGWWLVWWTNLQSAEAA